MSIKLIAIDIDGTLLNADHVLTQRTVDTIRTATVKNIQVVLCSGRPYSGVASYLDQLGLNQSAYHYVITLNGAVVQTTSQKLLVSQGLNSIDYQKFTEMAQEKGIHFHAETEDAIYTPDVPVGRYTTLDATLTGLPVMYQPGQGVSAKAVIYKGMLADEPERLTRFLADQQLVNTLQQKYYVVRSQPYFLEIMNAHANKGAALAFLGQQLGVTPDEMMAMGDQANDLTMMSFVDNGVAMGNAIPEVKQAAKFVTATNDEDGVAVAIEKYVL